MAAVLLLLLADGSPAIGRGGTRVRGGVRDRGALLPSGWSTRGRASERRSVVAFVRSPRVPYPLGLLSNDSFPDLLGCLHLRHLLIPLFLTRKLHPLFLPH